MQLIHYKVLTFIIQAILKGRKYNEADIQKGFLTILELCKPPVINEAYPLHDAEQCRALSSMLLYSVLPNKSFKIDHIRNYFGMQYSKTYYSLLLRCKILIAHAHHFELAVFITITRKPNLNYSN